MSPSTLTQVDKAEREVIQPRVLPEAVKRLREYCGVTGKAQGEVIDELVLTHLPIVTLTHPSAGKAS